MSTLYFPALVFVFWPKITLPKVVCGRCIVSLQHPFVWYCHKCSTA